MKAVVCFSRPGANWCSGSVRNLETGNTLVIARMIAEGLGCEVHEIEALEPYPGPYKECVARAVKEMKAKTCTPIRGLGLELHDGDVLYLGYPDWCGTFPSPVRTFLSTIRDIHLTLYPFCTHEGSGMGTSLDDLRELLPKATIADHIAIHGSEAATAGDVIHSWCARHEES